VTAISLPQAIRNAIETEKSASSFYRSLLPQARDENARVLLETIARDEDAHAHQLEHLAEEVVGGSLPDAADELSHLVESSPPPSPDVKIGFVRALLIALEAEHHAAHFYSLVAEATSGDVRTLLRNSPPPNSATPETSSGC
jgi:rubrerythrin